MSTPMRLPRRSSRHSPASADARSDRPHPHLPELLARGRDNRTMAMAQARHRRVLDQKRPGCWGAPCRIRARFSANDGHSQQPPVDPKAGQPGQVRGSGWLSKYRQVQLGRLAELRLEHILGPLAGVTVGVRVSGGDRRRPLPGGSCGVWAGQWSHLLHALIGKARLIIPTEQSGPHPRSRLGRLAIASPNALSTTWPGRAE